MKQERNRWQEFCAWVDGEEWCAKTPEEVSSYREEAPKGAIATATWKRARRINKLNRWVGVLFCVGLAIVLTLVVLNLPAFGDPSNPANNEIPQRYIEQGVQETGAVNLVAGMILSYRVFDTFGESNVLFLAATCVTMLLRRDKKNTTARDLMEMHHEDESDKVDPDPILDTCVLLLTPMAILVGFYVMLFGHLSPGGGFSGGSILGGGLILYSRTMGSESVRRFFNQRISDVVRVVCLLGYGLLLTYYTLSGNGIIPAFIPLGTPGHILSSGIIMPIDIMVGFVVTCTIYSFYALFSKGEV